MDKDILRLLTCGSVDDGKSTLIGRLLYDSNLVFKDQLITLKRDSLKYGSDDIDYSLLLDGLASEREQKITIDVAYRYFETLKRKFIIADTPGHEQYTRNMITGASNSELAIVLIDASKGVLTQSKRHMFLVSLLQISHVVIAINKMDLVKYDEKVFKNIVKEIKIFSRKLNIKNISFIPVSALKGDNVVSESKNMSWYKGQPLLSFLETIFINDDNFIDFRFPVQNVIRPNQNFRGYAGRISSGKINIGEKITALPSGIESKVKEIYDYTNNLECACIGQSIVLTLDDEIDISRGDIIVRQKNLPCVSSSFIANICWMSDDSLNLDKTYILKCNTFTTKAFINELFYKFNVNIKNCKKITLRVLNGGDGQQYDHAVWGLARLLYIDNKDPLKGDMGKISKKPKAYE